MENKIYGYVRVSTKKQSAKLQRDAISAYSRIDKFFEDVFTGTKIDRDGFNDLVKAVDKDLSDGNTVTIIFYSVSRMSRNASEGVKQYFEWYDRGVELVFLNEHHIDTAVYRKAVNNAISLHINSDKESANKFFNTMIAAMNELQRDLAKEQIILAFAQSEKEVKDLQKRTKDGMEAKGAAEKISKARTGQTFTTVKEYEVRIDMLKKLKEYGGTYSLSDVAKQNKVSRMSIYRYKDNIEADKKNGKTEKELLREYAAIVKDRKSNKAE